MHHSVKGPRINSSLRVARDSRMLKTCAMDKEAKLFHDVEGSETIF